MVIATGCNVPVNRNQEFDTALAKVTRVGNVYAPYGGQPVSATYASATGPVTVTTDTGQTYTVSPAGSQSPVNGTTATSSSTAYTAATTDWPTSFVANNMNMPANWTVSFTPNQTCYDPSTSPTAAPPYPTEPAVQSSVQELIPGVGGVEPWWGYIFDVGGPASANPPTPIIFTCFVNTPANPQIVQSAVQPRFVLDDHLPATVQVAALTQINAAPSQTFLRLFSADLQQFTSTAATSVAPGGMSATFPYPTGANGSALPAGTYIGTITTDVTNQQETTNALEPFVIGHDVTTYPGAFGVAFAAPQALTTGSTGSPGTRGQRCTSESSIDSTVGFTGPIVTSITQNALLLPNGTSVAVGAQPTVVVPINYTTSSVTYAPDQCTSEVTQYSGPQSAFVVNTGGNSVSIVEIGQQSFPQGTIAVGVQPVAAAVGTNGLVYVANYGSGTISEVNPATLAQTRTLAVMQHPTSLSFDTSGNLWVGGQGFVDEVSISNWAVSTSTAVDGTVNGMSYAPKQQVMVQMLMQNGTVGSPAPGGTHAQAVLYTSPQSSYSTVNLMGDTSLASSGPTLTTVSNASYVGSPVAQYLAFPAQTAFAPQTFSGAGLSYPAITSTNNDVVAVATGNSFTIASLPSGEALLEGTVPYPIRGVAVGTSAVYLTMTESDSVVTIPFNFK